MNSRIFCFLFGKPELVGDHLHRGNRNCPFFCLRCMFMIGRSATDFSLQARIRSRKSSSPNGTGMRRHHVHPAEAVILAACVVLLFLCAGCGNEKSDGKQFRALPNSASSRRASSFLSSCSISRFRRCMVPCLSRITAATRLMSVFFFTFERM